MAWLRPVVMVVAVVGCVHARSTLGVGGSGPTRDGDCAGCTAGLAGPSVSLGGELQTKLDDHVYLGLYWNLTMRNWHRTALAYRSITDYAKRGKTTCCGDFNDFTTMGKYIGVFFGYAGAWLLATNLAMVGPTLSWRQNDKGPSAFVTMGGGPAGFVDEKRSYADTFGVALTLAGGYDWEERVGMEGRLIIDPIDSRWVALSLGVVLRR